MSFLISIFDKIYKVMSRKESLIRHKIIIQKLRSRPATFEEILDRVEQEDSEIKFSLRTFQRDIMDIQEIHGVEIKFDRSDKVYRIVSDDNDAYSERMFEALDIFQALNLNNTMGNFIQFDTRKPKGTKHLNGILHAIQNRFQMQISYHKFWEDQSEKRIIEPYLLKEFKGRWYVVAFDLDKKALRIFGLDRILDLHISDIKFQYPQKNNIRKYFEDCFGIISPNNRKPEKIKLLFTENQGKYIKIMPLHSSQKITEIIDDKMTVELNLIPSYDFEMELLSQGEFVKVLEPKSLAENLKRRMKNMVKVYE